MENIGWWFKSTDQGMWPMTLQNAEDTICLGWLLYSANEFDREALCREIWQFTGVSVSLRFREIDDGNGRLENREIIKALHIDLNKSDPQEYKCRLEALYSSSAKTFPLGIKMRLVRDFKLLTNINAKEKARSLRATQGQFLQQTETCITWEIATIDLEDKTLRNSLRAILMNIPDPEHLDMKLFHSVNKMFKQDGYIFRFHPSRGQNAREVVAGLLVFLKGIWSGVVNVEKFNKFFSVTALERAKEAWWDPENRCVITKADRELELLLTADKDMIFQAKAITIDTTQVAQATSSTGNDGLLSTGSISTFRTNTSKPPLKRQRQPQVSKASTPTTDTVSTTTGLTGFSASDPELKQLLLVLLQTLQNSSLPSSGSTGGPKTGGQS